MSINKNYKIYVPGKVIINGGYLVLEEPNKCASIVPNLPSTISVNIEKSEYPKIIIYTNFDDKSTFFYIDNRWSFKGEIEKSMLYCYEIIKLFYKIMDIVPKNITIELKIELNNALFSKKHTKIANSIKTGLGSSCVFIIGLVKALLPFDAQNDVLFKTCLKINKEISPQSSSCDISSVIYGNIIYTKYNHFKYFLSNNIVLVLGSFNKSTNTRNMTTLYDPKSQNWKNLKSLNDDIIKIIEKEGICENNQIILKNFYKMYIDILSEISEVILPKKQYEILNQTFSYNIIGCGVSGSGGEDCVWCLVEQENSIQVVNFWKSRFEFVTCVNDLSGKIDFSY